MLLQAITDGILMKTKYRQERLSFLYNVMIAQKHRMILYKRYKKKYLKQCTKDLYWEKLDKKSNANTVWIMWMQGIENAPEIVQTCVESIKKNVKGKEIIILDKNNISEYVDIPQFIVDKWEKGIIGNAHFSDIVRLEVLIKYGGYWMDSTILCTDASMLEIIDKQKLFMYSFYYFAFNPEIMETNNWFIYSEANNNILCLEREFLYEFWKRKNRAQNYFFFHIFMTIALEYYKEEYSQMPIVSQVDSHILATYIFDQFDEDKYNLLRQSTGFHKLSTRFDTEGMKKKGTFYDVVIRNKMF